jgi:hypothetical protein
VVFIGNPMNKQKTLLSIFLATIGIGSLIACIYFSWQAYLSLSKGNLTTDELSKTLFMPGFFLFFGLAMTIGGITSLNLNSMRKQELEEKGILVNATITQIAIANSTGRGRYRKITSWWIYCTYQIGNKKYDAYAGIDFNPSEMLAKMGISTIPVYVDPANPKKYYVAVDKLKGLLPATNTETLKES